MSTLVANNIDLKVSEDSYLGDAKFALSAGGLQVGNVQTVTASHAKGQWQDIDISLAAGIDPKTLSISFLNDAWGGTAALDRNLYVGLMSMDGSTYTNLNAPGTETALDQNGTANFQQASTITLDVAEDSYIGDAQFIVTVDGNQVGGVQTATANHSSGEWQAVTLAGNFAANPQNVGVQFLNDAWGGSAALDRNLYVGSIGLNGRTYNGADAAKPAGTVISGTAALLNMDGAISFGVGTTPSTATSPSPAVHFDSGQYVTLGNKLQFDSGQSWSMASTIKVGTPAPGPGYDLPDGGASLVFGNTNGAPYKGYELWLDQTGSMRVRIMSSFLDGQYIDVAGNTDIADGNMHFIGATYDGSSTAAGVKLYVDGALEGTHVLRDTLTGSSASNGPMIIGNQLNGWENQFQLRGDMLTFSLSDVVRDAASFQPISHLAPVMDAHTQLALDFSARTGITTPDLSGHANNGTLSSLAMWT